MNSISKIKNILVIIVVSAAFFSCENNVEEESPNNEEELCNSDISFTSKVKPIIDNNCIRCHGGNQLPDLRSYTRIKNNTERIKEQVVNRTMPQGGSLTSAEIELIRCWIENGAIDN